MDLEDGEFRRRDWQDESKDAGDENGSHAASRLQNTAHGEKLRT